MAPDGGAPSTPEPMGGARAAAAAPAAASVFSRWYMHAALVLLPLLLYCESLGFGLLDLDDTIYFKSNALLHGGRLAGLLDVWTRPYFDDFAPITQVTIWFDALLRQDGSFMLVRAHQLLWMGLCALAVFHIMRRLTGRDGLAWAVAFMYVLHPVCAESSLWLAERKNLVSIALSLWAIERHMAWRQGAGRRALLAAILLCPLALLAKAHAVVIPAVIACYEATLVRASLTSRALAIAPSAALTLAFLVWCMASIHLYDSHAKTQLGGSLAATVLCDGAILARYLDHAAAPHHLAIFYRVIEDPARWPRLVGMWLLVLGAVAMSIAVVRERRLAIFAWCAAICSILPVINLKPGALPMSDHFLQWSLPWLLLILALMASRLVEVARQREWRVSATLLAAVYALFLATVSLTRVPEFSSLLRLASTAVNNQGDCAINWSMYCAAQERNSPPDFQEAGRAGMIAYGCEDYRRIFTTYTHCCAVWGTLECRRIYGEAASQRLLAKALSQMKEQARCYITGKVLFLEGRYAESASVLAKDYSPPVRAAAHACGELCRSGDRQPWDFPAASDPEDRQTTDPRVVDTRNSFSLEVFSTLADDYTRSGDAASGFDLAALLVNMYPGDAYALSIYADACGLLGLPRSVEQAKRRLATIDAATPK